MAQCDPTFYAMFSDEELNRMVVQRNHDLSVRDYCGDLNAAWDLVDGLKCGILRTRPHGVQVQILVEPYSFTAKAEADSPARAIVIAWLQWQEARDGN